MKLSNVPMFREVIQELNEVLVKHQVEISFEDLDCNDYNHEVWLQKNGHFIEIDEVNGKLTIV